jgi:hypothetical protein
MRLLHSAKDTCVQFDEPNLVSCVGLVPVMRLAQDCDLAGLVAEHVKVVVAVGANAHLKIPAVVAGMIVGADSIDDLDVLRHGGMTKLFGGIRAPSTLGSFLRGFDWGNVRQLEVVSRELLANLAEKTPVLTDAHVMAHLDIDSAQRRVYATPNRAPGSARRKSAGTRCGYGGSTRCLRRCPPRPARRCWSVPGYAAGPRTPRAAPPPSPPRRSPPPARLGPPGR